MLIWLFTQAGMKRRKRQKKTGLLPLTYLLTICFRKTPRLTLPLFSQPHACGFITAVPSDEDGKETLLRPRNFQIAVAHCLGVPVLDHEIPCPLCKQPINIFGGHPTCCAKKGDVIIRHNSLRNDR